MISTTTFVSLQALRIFFWFSSLSHQALFNPQMAIEWIKILFACLLDLGRPHSSPISSQP